MVHPHLTDWALRPGRSFSWPKCHPQSLLSLQNIVNRDDGSACPVALSVSLPELWRYVESMSADCCLLESWKQVVKTCPFSCLAEAAVTAAAAATTRRQQPATSEKRSSTRVSPPNPSAEFDGTRPRLRWPRGFFVMRASQLPKARQRRHDDSTPLTRCFQLL